ncbi:hypothetical protein MKX01_020865 [Papaver californicum]|nr:hypothetical protein MKX01_020865 [Papaver californicum]
MEAEEKGAFAGIRLDNDGFAAEGTNMNAAFVSNENELLMPYFDNILSGCTAKRVLDLAKRLVQKEIIARIKVEMFQWKKGAKGMMLIGSGILVQWDDQIIADGKEGPIALALLNLTLGDMKSGHASVRVPVPY